MATGRTLKRWLRAYVDGVDLSGDARAVGPLEWDYSGNQAAAFADSVQGTLPMHPNITPTAIQAFLDNTTGHVHDLFEDGAGLFRNVMIAQGIRAAPAAGDPVYMGEFEQLSYKEEEGDGFTIVSMNFSPSARRAVLYYEQPWGVLLHAKGAETGVNTAVGIDDNGASSVLGGLMAYQLFSSNGTLAIKTEHASANNDASFAQITGATSGNINASTTPVGGFVAIAKGTTINRYLRWQITLGTATTATFALAFIRANR